MLLARRCSLLKLGIGRKVGRPPKGTFASMAQDSSHSNIITDPKSIMEVRCRLYFKFPVLRCSMQRLNDMQRLTMSQMGRCHGVLRLLTGFYYFLIADSQECKESGCTGHQDRKTGAEMVACRHVAFLTERFREFTIAKVPSAPLESYLR